MKKTILIACVAVAACKPTAMKEPAATPSSTVTVHNARTTDATVNIAFGSDSVVGNADLPMLCKPTTKLNCSGTLKAGARVDLKLNGRYLNATFAFNMPVGCGATKAELNVNNPKWFDTYDISIVDGFNVPVQIAFDQQTIQVTSADNNESNVGVFPVGCDGCALRIKPPCGLPVGAGGCHKGTQFQPDPVCQVQGPTNPGSSKVTVVLMKAESKR